jgi:hypothetical protein
MHTLLLSRATGLIEGLCTQLVPGQGFLTLIRPRLGALTWKVRLDTAIADLRESWTRLKKLPDRMEEALAQRGDVSGSAPSLALLAAVILIAAMMLEPGTARVIAASCAGAAVITALLLRR